MTPEYRLFTQALQRAGSYGALVKLLPQTRSGKPVNRGAVATVAKKLSAGRTRVLPLAWCPAIANLLGVRLHDLRPDVFSGGAE